MTTVRYLLSLIVLLTFTSSYSLGQTWPTNEGPETSKLGFSLAMAIDGDQILATRTGDSYMFPTPPSQKGGLFTFEKKDSKWMLASELIPEDVQIGDSFGTNMLLSGNMLFVSATNSQDGCGSVFILKRENEGADWMQAGVLTAPDCNDVEGFGGSLALNESSLFVGAPGTEEKVGQAFRFDKSDSGSWELGATYKSGMSGDQFGTELAFFENELYIGAPSAGEKSGLVYIFDAQTAEQTASIANPDSSSIYFGKEIEIAGDKMGVGAPGTGSGGPPQTGAAFIYQKSDDGWQLNQSLLPELGEDQPPFSFFAFGGDIEFSGEDIWVSVPYGGSNSGAVHIYDQAGDIKQTLTTRPLASFASFGFEFEVEENLAVVGVLSSDFGEGRAVVFEHDGESWVEANSITDSGRKLQKVTDEEIQCVEGKAGEFDCGEVDLLSFLPISDVGGERGVIVNDVWGWTDTETEKEYAIVGRSNGTSFIDVTNPTNPIFVADLPATEGSHPNAWRDVKTYKHYAFVVADNVGKHGMQVFDLHELRDITDAPVTVESSALYEEIYSAHNVIINEDTGFAYIVAASGGGETCGGGYHMVDVNDPLNPTFAGCFSDPSSGAGGNHIHDAQCVLYDGPDQDYQGNEICFGANASVFSIADVSDKENPKTVSALDYPNVAYVHQGWLTDDKKYFYINDEGDEVSELTEATRTLIWDVEDLDDPIFLKAHLGTTQASDHNFYIRDNLMYQSNYVSGLQILDISDPLNPKQVAHFDTFPWGENAPGFAGSWSNYPYFQSGTIVVSSVTEGLFLVKKQPQQLP